MYIILVTKGEYDERYTYALEGGYSTYELAKEYLLKNFEAVEFEGSEYFYLKDGHEYLANFGYDARATIEKIHLIK